jgi:protocatechuate 3,4-dioxygenase beta subunit
MERNDFLKALSLGLFLPLLNSCNVHDTDNSTLNICLELPDEEEGPFPYTGGELNNPFNRSDITDGQTGVPLSLNFALVNISTACRPIVGARVNIWHCNKDGYYSGYANQNGSKGVQDFTSQSWLRGNQISDASGNLTFKTIYPGWEPGRATHLHVEVYINGTLKKTGQMAFPERASDLVHASPLYAAHGVDPTRNAKDPVFAHSNDINAETLAINGDVANGFVGLFKIGLRL